MIMAKRDKKNGFTIIEVALVLAIAGLIFLVVFLALPALQRSQHDTALRQDTGTIVSALQSYSADNQGQISNVTSDIIQGYTGSMSRVTTVNVQTTPTAVPSDNATAVVTTHALCGSTTVSDGKPIASGQGKNGNTVSARTAAVVTHLESKSYYCEDM